tara:strand:- start:68 stop:946 length:879 start_codon:yes stop_codon:yes gene_type:complete
MKNNINKVTWVSENEKDYYPNKYRENKLPSGIYSSKYSQEFGEYLSKFNWNSDLPFSIFENSFNLIKDDLDNFWSLKDKYKVNGLEFNRAIMLHGEPGCGKKYLCRRVAEYFVENYSGIVIYSDEISDLKSLIESVKLDSTKEDKIMVIIEDAGILLEKNGMSSTSNIFKNKENEDGIYYLLTTNFEEKFGEYISDKPGYIEKSFLIDYPKIKEIEQYIKSLSIAMEIKTDSKKIAKDVLGLSIGHIRNLIESHFIFGYNYKETLLDLKEKQENIIKQFYSSLDSSDIGFGS